MPTQTDPSQPDDPDANYKLISGGICPECGATDSFAPDLDLHALTCSACFVCYRPDADARTARRIDIADLTGPAGDTTTAPMTRR